MRTYHSILMQNKPWNLPCLINKAFDVVCHSILIQTLSSWVIDGQLLSGISSFLSDRVMQVMQVFVHGHTSSPGNVYSGAPKCSALGPLLCFVYINFVGNLKQSPNFVGSKLSCTYKVVADDIKLFASDAINIVSLQPETYFSLQHDTVILFKISLCRGLHMNKTTRQGVQCYTSSRKFRAQSQPMYRQSNKYLPSARPARSRRIGSLAEST